MKKIYIAGSFASLEERKELEEVIDYTRRTNPTAELFVPMEHFIPGGETMNNNEWGNRVYEMDMKAIRDCDELVVLYRGRISGTGTAFEVGAAKMLGKRITIHVSKVAKIVSLMIMNSADVIICDHDIEQK